MKSHKLSKILLKYPDMEIHISIDVSTCDEDSGKRFFSHDLVEVQDDSYSGFISLLCDGGEFNE